MARALPIAALALASLAAFGQTFEVASVKPSGPRGMRNFDRDPGRISYFGAHLQDLLVKAWNLTDYSQISGPGWLSSETYDIVATFPPETTAEQVRFMLQNLLRDRFKLTLHLETKDFPVFNLVVAKNGPKLGSELSKAAWNKPGFPQLAGTGPALSTAHDAHGVSHMAARQEPVSLLARLLGGPGGPAGRLVIDKTGLTERYDFTLEFKHESTPDDDPAPSLFDALQEQLGMKLEAAKAPFDVLVIDHAEKVPTEN
jgi:uncharacterized protein (TIGR03435 family)